MPTIHLSLPEGLYRELRRYADFMGVQMTDLVKFMINKGLEELREKMGNTRNDDIENTLKIVLASLEKMEKKLTLMELKIKEQEIKFKEYVSSIESRLNDIELSLQEVQSPVIEPEIIHTRRIKKRI